MTDRLYPVSLEEVESWSRRHAVTLQEGRQRFVQFVLLECLATGAPASTLAFKGGNALRFAYDNPRSTIDLDFTASPGFPDDPDRIRNILDEAIRVAPMRYAVRFRTQRIKRNPTNPERTMPTYEVRIGYQIRGDRWYEAFEERTSDLSTVIEVEITLNDEICETRNIRLSSTSTASIRVCVLEDIIAEKLRALLQQRIRNRHRWQDVFDIARMMRDHGESLDRTKIASYFLRKCRIRQIEPVAAMFDGEIKRRASAEYGHLFQSSDPAFIPFEEAWAEVMELVSSLDIATG
jgi:predicted nucleotidyltransferase component of viral defense system